MNGVRCAAQPTLSVVVAKGRADLAATVRALGLTVVEDWRQAPTLLSRDRAAKPWAPNPEARRP